MKKLAIVLILVAFAAAAQEKKPTGVDALRQRANEQLKAAAERNKTAPAVDPTAPDELIDVEADEPTKKMYLAAQREYYAYKIDGLRHRRNVYAWQLSSGRAIFVVVVLLVLSGIYFAAVQFHAGLRHAKEGAATAPVATEFSASADGLKVSSPVLGVIILVISLAFFYVYLVFVYPISETF